MTVKVELFTSDACRRCSETTDMLQDVIRSLGTGHFDLHIIDVVVEIDTAVAAGVLFTPALRINGGNANAALQNKQALRKVLSVSLHGLADP